MVKKDIRIEKKCYLKQIFGQGLEKKVDLHPNDRITMSHPKA